MTAAVVWTSVITLAEAAAGFTLGFTLRECSGAGRARSLWTAAAADAAAAGVLLEVERQAMTTAKYWYDLANGTPVYTPPPGREHRRCSACRMRGAPLVAGSGQAVVCRDTADCMRRRGMPA